MNSLTLGFFYLVGLVWGLSETCMIASNGNWTPLIIFLLGFVLLFAIVGCWPLPDEKVNFLGSIFAVILGLGLLMIAVGSFFAVPEGAGVGGPIIKTLIAALFVVFGLISFVNCKSSGSEQH